MHLLICEQKANVSDESSLSFSEGVHVLTQATRSEIERALTSLLLQAAPADDKLVNYESTISAKITERLRFRKDVLSKKWLKNLIRDAFHTYAGERNMLNNHNLRAQITQKAMIYV